MEVAVIIALAAVVKDLHAIASKLQENKEQCLRLCLHINSILDVLEEECKNGVPPMLSRRIVRLSSALLDLTIILEGLHKSSFLQRVIWRHQVSTKVQELYRCISEAVQDVKLGIAFDVSRAQADNEHARQLDAANTRKNFDQLLHNDKEIIGALEVQQQQMQEAVVCLHRYLEQLPDSSERRFLRNGMHTLQRRSGPLRLIPDVFVITSLDVIIHYDRKLGEGGFTRVYEGLWGGTKVAIKVMEKGVPATAIQQEVDVWKRLRHPNILEFYGACSIADPPFMVCAYKENGDAVEYLRRSPNASRHQLLYEAVVGLVYLHQNGVVHGDIKATNILVDKYGKACLSDFGLSQIKIHTTTVRGLGNSTGHGTARWMAPEHMLQGVMSKRTDVYSFGMTMYEVFSGAPPFAATPEPMLIQVICDRKVRPLRPEDPSATKNGLSDSIWELMNSAWAHEPERRPAASDLQTKLARHAAKVHPQPDTDDEEADVSENVENSVTAREIPAFWRDETMSHDHHAAAALDVSSSSGQKPGEAATSRQKHTRSVSTPLEATSDPLKAHRAPPPPPLSPSDTPATPRRFVTPKTPSSQSLNSTYASPAQGSRPSTRRGSGPSGTPYISRGARDLIEFLDDGPPPEDDSGKDVGSQPHTTPKKSSGLSQLPRRIRKISKKIRSTEDKADSSNGRMPTPETSPKVVVSPDVRELIDFLEEGPPEDADASAGPSKLPSPNSNTFFNKLPLLTRPPRQRRPKDIAVDLPDIDTSPLFEARLSPHSPVRSSQSSGSQPYISQSARDLVEFLDEGPPQSMRKGRKRRNGSNASNDSGRSMSSFQALRNVLSRNPGHLAQGSEETDFAEHVEPSRPLSTASSDMFTLPIPGVFEDSIRYDGPAMSASEALQLVQQQGTLDQGLVSGLDEAGSQATPSDPSPASEESQTLLLAQPTPPVGIATPALVVLSSLALYMLFSMPIS